MYTPSNCIVCYSPNSHSSGINTTQGQLDTPDSIENGKFILKTFCSSFGINLPLTLTHSLSRGEHLKKVIDWNLTNESLPFCSSCEPLVDYLVELCQQLETLKHEIEISKARIKSEIIKSSQSQKKSRTVSAGDQESELKEAGIDNLMESKHSKTKLNQKGKNFRGQRSKDKVEILRELLVGPELRISRCNLPASPASVPVQVPVPNQEKRAACDSTIRIPSIRRHPKASQSHTDNQETIKYQDPLESESDPGDFTWSNDDEIGPMEFENETETSVSYGSGVGPDLNFDTRDNRGPVIIELEPETKSENPVKLRTKTKVKFEAIRGPMQKIEIPDYVENQGMTQTKFKQEESNDDNEDDNCISDNNAKLQSESESESDLEPADDDSNDEDFTISDSDAELVEQCIARKNHRRKSNAPDYVPSKKLSMKKYVGEDQIDKYVYADRYEFSGNELVGFQCGLCPGRSYPHLKSIRMHIRDMHIKKELSTATIEGTGPGVLCTICGKLLKCSQGLELHMQVHQEKRKTCEICGEKFRTDILLKFHKEKKHRDKAELRVVCEYCGKVMATRVHANRHVRAVHNNVKRHFCHLCGKGFFESNSMRTHIATVHTTDKPFACQYCDQKFNRKGHMKRHERQFHGYLESQGQSQNQSQSEGQSEGQNQGQIPSQSQIHTQKPNPPQLSSEEVVEASWKSHLKCKYCGLQYNRQNNLTRHLLQIHNIDVKGVAWKCKYRPMPKQTKPKTKVEPDREQRQEEHEPVQQPIPPVDLPLNLQSPFIPFFPFSNF